MIYSCAVLTDWFGWLSAAFGLLGALLLTRPLFLLLGHREALDALVQALDAEIAPDDLKQHFSEARKIAAAKLYAGRRSWKRWAYPGVALLVLAAVPLVLQFGCML
jgi:hypothetical protein